MTSFVQPGASIVDLDMDSLAKMTLDGRLCLHCPLLEDQSLVGFSATECRIRMQDLEPLVADSRSGVKVAVRDGELVGYTVFGRPRLFRNLRRLPFDVEEDALLIAALYVVANPGIDSLDSGILISVMDFAREQGYDVVQAVCRTEESGRPEPPAQLLGAAGFEMSEAVDGLCLAQSTVTAWDESAEDAEDEDEQAI